MMKEEFEKIVGYEVSPEDYYKIIEPMYMAIDCNKKDFCKMLSKKRFALKPISTYKAEIRNCMRSLRLSCDHYTDYPTIDRMHGLCDDVKKRINAKDYMIENHTTLSHCYYPCRIVFYDEYFATILEI